MRDPDPVWEETADVDRFCGYSGGSGRTGGVRYQDLRDCRYGLLVSGGWCRAGIDRRDPGGVSDSG